MPLIIVERIKKQAWMDESWCEDLLLSVFWLLRWTCFKFKIVDWNLCCILYLALASQYFDISILTRQFLEHGDGTVDEFVPLDYKISLFNYCARPFLLFFNLRLTWFTLAKAWRVIGSRIIIIFFSKSKTFAHNKSSPSAHGCVLQSSATLTSTDPPIPSLNSWGP